MTQQLEIEGTWEEILAQGDQLAGHRVRVTILSDEDEEISPEESLRRGLQDMKEGRLYPISELWDGIDAE